MILRVMEALAWNLSWPVNNDLTFPQTHNKEKREKEKRLWVRSLTGYKKIPKASNFPD